MSIKHLSLIIFSVIVLGDQRPQGAGAGLEVPFPAIVEFFCQEHRPVEGDMR